MAKRRTVSRQAKRQFIHGRKSVCRLLGGKYLTHKGREYCRIPVGVAISIWDSYWNDKTWPRK
jgi:hypothetical protein